MYEALAELHQSQVAREADENGPEVSRLRCASDTAAAMSRALKGLSPESKLHESGKRLTEDVTSALNRCVAAQSPTPAVPASRYTRRHTMFAPQSLCGTETEPRVSSRLAVRRRRIARCSCAASLPMRTCLPSWERLWSSPRQPPRSSRRPRADPRSPFSLTAWCRRTWLGRCHGACHASAHRCSVIAHRR